MVIMFWGCGRRVKGREVQGTEIRRMEGRTEREREAALPCCRNQINDYIAFELQILILV